MQVEAVGPDQERLRGQQGEPCHGRKWVQMDNRRNLSELCGMAEVTEERRAGDARRKTGNDQHEKQQEEKSDVPVWALHHGTLVVESTEILAGSGREPSGAR